MGTLEVQVVGLEGAIPGGPGNTPPTDPPQGNDGGLELGGAWTQGAGGGGGGAGGAGTGGAGAPGGT